MPAALIPRAAKFSTIRGSLPSFGAAAAKNPTANTACVNHRRAFADYHLPRLGVMAAAAVAAPRAVVMVGVAFMIGPF
jgi:hypothetical protein